MRQSSFMMPAGSRDRPGPRAVVLQATHHVIERHAIVGMNLVELADRDVVNGFPRLAAIVTDRNAAVLSLPHPFRILRIEPERVKVDVSAAGDRAKSLS